MKVYLKDQNTYALDYKKSYTKHKINYKDIFREPTCGFAISYDIHVGYLCEQVIKGKRIFLWSTSVKDYRENFTAQSGFKTLKEGMLWVEKNLKRMMRKED